LTKSQSLLGDRRPIIVWFRRDLRLEDNPSLAAAVQTGRPIIPVFILELSGPGRAPGAASLWWLNKSLAFLGSALDRIGSRLILRCGDPAEILSALAFEADAAQVFWCKIYEPAVQERDAALALALKAAGVATASFNASLLLEPGRVRTGAGNFYTVFTPFWRATSCEIDPIRLSPTPAILRPPLAWPKSDCLTDWKLHPTQPDWSVGFDIWSPGEAGAKARLDKMIQSVLGDYAEGRDIPGMEGTSRLSPHLAWGEIGPHQIYSAVEKARAGSPSLGPGADKYLAEIGWREFNYNILALHPQMSYANLKSAFDGFPWRNDPLQVEVWRTGQTGYPIVDAGMRQLWSTGWMHNRVRMIVASFLIKHLLIDWRIGEAWFWDTLVDADPASNPGGWQWVAGSGADAAPFFRIFNPVSQGERFDPQGAYVRKWVPELAQLPDKAIHAPWSAPPFELAVAGVRLGDTYPYPMVDHAFARNRALAAFETLKRFTAAR
jgi:deoxyribodipyrimidine photo-lyase